MKGTKSCTSRPPRASCCVAARQRQAGVSCRSGVRADAGRPGLAAARWHGGGAAGAGRGRSNAPALQLLLHSLQVFHEQVLARELIVVAEVVDALVVLQVHVVKVVAHPANVAPVDIPICVAVRLAPPRPRVHHIEHSAAQRCPEQDRGLLLLRHRTGTGEASKARARPRQQFKTVYT